MPAFPLPRNSTPGSRPGEGEGRLLNCYFSKEGERAYIRRVPGLKQNVDTGYSAPRGMLAVNGVFYIVYTGAVVTVTGTTVVVLTGSIPGSDGVTLARNNKTTGDVSTPDIVAVRSSGGAYVLTGSDVTAYSDADLPASTNSVDFMGGYFLFSVPDGRIFASELNSTDINALSFTTAEARADGLNRIVVQGSIAYAMGASTIEPYLNVGLSPFPLQRAQSVEPVGIKTTMAVAGFEEGWDQPLFFVASDNTVRALSGYETRTISTADVDRFVAGSDASTLEMLVFTWSGRGYVALSSATGTWVYSVSENAWHERASATLPRWRASRSTYAFGGFWLGDRLSGAVSYLANEFTENGSVLGGQIRTGQLKEFPARVSAKLAADFTEADLTIFVSWSHDGGKTWSTELQRPLASAEKWPLTVSSLGLSTHHGITASFRWEGAADFSFMGATAERADVRNL